MDEVRVGEKCAAAGNARGLNIDACIVLGAKAQPQKLKESAAAAASDIEHLGAGGVNMETAERSDQRRFNGQRLE